MSEPEPEAKPEAGAGAKLDPKSDAARVYDQLSFDRAPVLRTVAAGEPSVARALLLGFSAAVLGAVVFFVVLWLTGYQLGLISIAVGIAVGVAVRTGANGSSHRGFRVLAVALSYFSVALTYVPPLLAEFPHPSILAVIASVLGALTVPFQQLLGGEIMTAVIAGIALWEAWRFSAPQVVAVHPAPPGPPAPPAP
jgi:hypothetical protein